jgi:hypothetical protein
VYDIAQDFARGIEVRTIIQAVFGVKDFFRTWVNIICPYSELRFSVDIILFSALVGLLIGVLDVHIASSGVQ